MNKVKNIAFDLDGTLLPMDYNKFIESYYRNMKITLNRYPQYSFEEIVKACEKGIYAIVKNDGSVTNEEMFFKTVGKRIEVNDTLIKMFYDFYDNEYKNMKKDMGYQKLAKEVLELLVEKGYNLYCFTSPLFPSVATIERLHWAGIDESIFKDITTFEKYSFAKPNVNYYKEALSKNNLNAHETLMIGNDVEEDLPIKELGSKVYLISDCLLKDRKSVV